MNSLIWAVAFFIFLSDQVSKYLIARFLEGTGSFEIIKGFFHLTLVRNSGAAFGIFRNQTLFFVGVSVLAVISIILYLRKRPGVSLLRDMSLALILGGALGNLVDRIRFGYVIDFLDFRIWPVFNIADSAITIGVFLLIIGLCTRYFSK